jgi:hypothetical protein
MLPYIFTEAMVNVGLNTRIAARMQFDDTVRHPCDRRATMNRLSQLCISARILHAFGTTSSPKADVNIRVGKLRFGLTKAARNGKIEAR